jgi:hypothetical protein
MSQILNRISMGLAKHERILSTLKRPVPSPSSAQSSKPTASTSGFSSLASGVGVAYIPPLSAGATGKTTPTTINGRSSRKEEQDEFEADRALPPNAGIGFVEEKKTVEKGREDKMLRGRLLGKRGGKDDGRLGAGKRAAVEEESEEEEGRSGLGKKKRRKRMVEPLVKEDGEDKSAEKSAGGGDQVGAGTVSVKQEDEGASTATRYEPTNGADEAAANEAIKAEEGMQPAGVEETAGAEQAEVKDDDAGTVVVESAGVLDPDELAAEKKRKRKQAKRKRSKANKAAQESAETGEAS